MAVDRFGIAFVHQPPEPRQGTYVRLAEDRGFESAWALETRLMRDGVTPLTAWAARTNRICLGTAMINPFTRTPTLMAQTFATLDEISNERSILGIGAANQMLVEDFHGEQFERPLTRTKETIEAFRQFLTGDRVDYDGETVSINGASLDFQPPRPNIPVYMGVTGPRMLRLAGAIADGVVLNAFVSEGYIKNAISLIEDGANEAGRDPPDVGMVPVFSIDADGHSAKETVKPLLAEYVCNLPGLEDARRKVGDPLFEREDVRSEIMEPVRETTETESIEVAAEHVPDDFVTELAAAGTPTECVERLDTYFDLGLDFLVPSLMGEHYGYGIETIADHFDLDDAT
ncbi:LLM class flavin-dependent oxidoreductase [Halorarum salinum]|uniref:LLM class flavin-dependent oxidoreductase n=1 Tax=Halorarum salinum TaxID=2743089 RepID=A0A7D5L8A8_9EURY|nr:LLM class flavin-dependent oxidoreductase [Halobaculum salinum]QLG60354.1 LLM class flavin-dependent oxidoreductase [Halobaculum salinum]